MEYYDPYLIVDIDKSKIKSKEVFANFTVYNMLFYFMDGSAYAVRGRGFHDSIDTTVGVTINDEIITFPINRLKDEMFFVFSFNAEFLLKDGQELSYSIEYNEDFEETIDTVTYGGNLIEITDPLDSGCGANEYCIYNVLSAISSMQESFDEIGWDTSGANTNIDIVSDCSWRFVFRINKSKRFSIVYNGGTLYYSKTANSLSTLIDNYSSLTGVNYFSAWAEKVFPN